MKWLIRIIDRDVVGLLNRLNSVTTKRIQARQFARNLGALYAPRPLWLGFTLFVFLLASPTYFLDEPEKDIAVILILALVCLFGGLWLYRLALVRQRFLDKREVDEFGWYEASPDDHYELPE